ncbi:DNA photolyase, FAD-binding/Cryptochrome [Mucor mucedo]|uniref:DNA photolyase, FAD-binding/Cryptochrome n=1 Tax=Mucor mucedo TaxID=29922 RepID=UPI00221EF7DE|nr:DNA photolyase, FAD-binding/Cryptochrome [Mucor mucedo]KAI7897126.1 DNA photolyase, FAD-binding/Cryptochrome [Mucor mucedo]
MLHKPINICFFRNIFRVHDNQSLHHAIQSSKHVLPVVCLDPRLMDISLLNDKLGLDNVTPKTHTFGLERCANFRTSYIIESIMALKQELIKRNSDLLILFGTPEDLFPALQKHLAKNHYQLEKIHTHKEYAFEELAVEKTLSKTLPMVYHHDTTMVHPDDIDFDNTYKVYTHFRKRIEKMDKPVREPLEIPKELPFFPKEAIEFQPNGEQHLQALYKDASVKSDQRNAFPWKGGEQIAKERLNDYLFKSDGVIDYKQTRNGLIGTEYSTKFSVFLSHGCLSPRFIWHEMERHKKEHKRNIKAAGDEDGIYWVKFELLWRDFFRYLVMGNGKKIFLLHGFRNMAPLEEDQKKPKNSYLDKVWKTNDEYFNKWKTGQTGSPFIDACMRELMYTGFMNNRGRQNVASYLAKDLEIDWRIGAEYFESILKDHDVYSNYGNWQYVSGVGCDPREGFRHFNVLKQSKDYDPEGFYIKLWCPELQDLPSHYVHCPWLMSAEEQKQYNCVIGRDYPEPMSMMESWKRHYPTAAKGSNKITKYLDTKNKKIKVK